MPLYEYQCTQCGHRLEIIEKFSDEPSTECPECGGLLERMLSAPAIRFKGSGWYINDYARKDGSSTKESKDPSTKASDSATKSGSTKETGSSSASDSSSDSSKKGE